MRQITITPVRKLMHFQYAIIIATCLVLPLLFSACSIHKRASVVEASPNVDLQVIERKTERINQLERENVRLANKLAEQKILSKKLQTALLTGHKETDACRMTNEKLIKELLQSRTKLANRGSKLEAATLIAEATAIISSVEKQSLDDRQKIFYKIAKQHLEESKRELKTENYEIASSLSIKAIGYVRSMDLDKEADALLPEEEIFFSTPMQMELFKTGNLRSSPSTKADIKTVLPAGSTVTAIGFQRNWVKIKSIDPVKTGWIHLSLLF